MALPHYSNNMEQIDPFSDELNLLDYDDIGQVAREPITPLKSNFFEIEFLDDKGDDFDMLDGVFFSYEKKMLGKESVLLLHLRMFTEKLNVFEKTQNICVAEITSFNPNTTIAFIQKFELQYLNYQISQNHHDDDILHMTYVYKILDEEITWI